MGVHCSCCWITKAGHAYSAAVYIRQWHSEIVRRRLAGLDYVHTNYGKTKLRSLSCDRLLNQQRHSFKPIKCVWSTTSPVLLPCCPLSLAIIHRNDVWPHLPSLLCFCLPWLCSHIDSTSMARPGLEFWNMFLHDVGVFGMLESIHKLCYLGGKCLESGTDLVWYLSVPLTIVEMNYWLTKIDPAIRIMMGASVGLPAASLCINRRLYQIASIQAVIVTRPEVR